jgi:hypothetical protein
MHCKSLTAQETRAVLTVRKLVQSKHHGTEINRPEFAAGLRP